MTEIKRTRRPSHPGAVLDDMLPALGKTKAEIATDLGLHPIDLEAFLDGRLSVWPELAAKIGALVGNGPDIWLRLQAAHDNWQEPK